VVRKLAMATARMPFEVKQRVNDTDSVNEDGPLQELLGAAEPAHVGFKLWEWTSSTRDVYGEAFWLKLRDRAAGCGSCIRCIRRTSSSGSRRMGRDRVRVLERDGEHVGVAGDPGG
jgi:phage portal protein BeeE